MRVLIVQPSHYLFKTGKLLKSKHKKGICPSFVLPYLASLFTKDTEITLIDETTQDVDFSVPYDLVGITVKTPLAKRAYEIAQNFRDRKIPVIMGGYHVNLCPEEAANHCDSLIIGEAESVWNDLIQDFRSGKPKERYISKSRFNMKSMTFPRYDLLDLSLYETFYGTKIPLETSRGCVNKCSYCCTPEVYKGGVIYRPTNEVVGDIKRIIKDFKRVKRPLFVFIDDNLTSNPSRCAELFEALIPLKIHWSGYFTSQICRRTELIKLAARSGCYSAFLGLESINVSALKAVNKEFNISIDYSSATKSFRANNIILIAGIILGLPGDSAATFRETIQFLDKNKIPVAVLHPLYPFPNTPVYEQLKMKGALNDETYWLKTHNPYSLFVNDNMDGQELSLEHLFEESLYRLTSYRSILRRTWPMKKYFFQLLAYNLNLRTLLRRKGIWAFI